MPPAGVARMSLQRKRTQARELAVQCLYQLDLLGRYDPDHIDATMRWSQVPEDAKEFARELVDEAWKHRAELDRRIKS